MLLLAVVEQALAVVGGQHDQRVVVAAELAQSVEQPADRGVGGGDLAVVGRAVARALGLGRRPGRVRLVEVDEEEEAAGPATPRATSSARVTVSRPARCTSPTALAPAAVATSS